MACLADEVIAAWSEAALSDHERDTAIAHAASCEACRELLGAMFGGATAQVAIGRYEILDTIGGGGMGIVLRGRDPVLGRNVAIKLARAGIDDHAQMLREAQALARLEHPNVVAVYDFGESGGEVFVAMALAEGVPLSQWLTGSHDVAARLRVLLDVASGLTAIHDAGLVHRDIKPANIVIRDNGQAVIVDLGLARPPGVGASGTGVAGTRGFVAPEVLAGAAASPASDQFAWWVLVGEVLPQLGSRRRARVEAARAKGTSTDRYPNMRAASDALRRACAPRWPTAGIALAAFAVAAVLAIVIGLSIDRPRDADPCHWTPKAWDDARVAVTAGLRAAGTDANRIATALERRADATRELRQRACIRARGADPAERSIGQYQVACVDRTWADAVELFEPMSSSERDRVWAGLDAFAIVLDPAHCARASAVIPPPSSASRPEIARLRGHLDELARDASLATEESLARHDALEAEIRRTGDAALLATLHARRAAALDRLGRQADAYAALAAADLAAEAAGEDDLRAEIAINRLIGAASTGQRDTAALEAHAQAIVDKLGNPFRRGDLAYARSGLLARRGDASGAVASMREAVAAYESVSLEPSDRIVFALMNLAGSIQIAEGPAAAAEVYERALAAARRRFGPDSAEVLEVRGARAANSMYAGDLDEARRELAVVADGLERQGGDDHAVRTANMMLCQAEMESRTSAAVPRCRVALDRVEKAYGPRHPKLVTYLALYGNALRIGGHATAAVEALERAISIGQDVGTIEPTDLAFAQAYLALALDPRDPRASASAQLAVNALAGSRQSADLVAELRARFPALTAPAPPR